MLDWIKKLKEACNADEITFYVSCRKCDADIKMPTDGTIVDAICDKCKEK